MRKSLDGATGGFTFIEVLVAMGLALVLFLAVTALVRPSFHVSELVLLRSEMQQNARAAINLVARDLTIAGTGIPPGGIQLPDGKGAKKKPRFGCDGQDCYVANNLYEDHRLYAVTPGDGKGIVVDGNATDTLTLVYRDDTLELDRYPLVKVTSSGSQIRVDPKTSPSIEDPAVGVKIGDVIVLSNANGSAAGVVTSVNGDKINFANSDPLNFNQPSASFGNIASLANPKPPAGQYPPTRAFRVRIVTYFLEEVQEGGGAVLMRQVNAQTAAPVAEDFDDFQVSYDLFDESTSAATSEQPDAAGMPNSIRKINLALRVRCPQEGFLSGDYQRISLTTSISARNLAFRDRYE